MIYSNVFDLSSGVWVGGGYRWAVSGVQSESPVRGKNLIIHTDLVMFFDSIALQNSNFVYVFNFIIPAAIVNTNKADIKTKALLSRPSPLPSPRFFPVRFPFAISLCSRGNRPVHKSAVVGPRS